MQDGPHSARGTCRRSCRLVNNEILTLLAQPLNGDVAVGDSQIDFVGLFDFVGRVGLEPTTQGL
jgi:hypothetical protein